MLSCMVNFKFALWKDFFVFWYFDNTDQEIQNTIQKFAHSSIITKRPGLLRKHDWLYLQFWYGLQNAFIEIKKRVDNSIKETVKKIN